MLRPTAKARGPGGFAPSTEVTNILRGLIPFLKSFRTSLDLRRKPAFSSLRGAQIFLIWPPASSSVSTSHLTPPQQRAWVLCGSSAWAWARVCRGPSRTSPSLCGHVSSTRSGNITSGNLSLSAFPRGLGHSVSCMPLLTFKMLFLSYGFYSILFCASFRNAAAGLDVLCLMRDSPVVRAPLRHRTELSQCHWAVPYVPATVL